MTGVQTCALPISGATARKRFGYACAALGVVLAVMGLASIWAFVGGKYPNVPENPKPAVSALVAPANSGGVPAILLG